jgi:hypothetical protein
MSKNRRGLAGHRLDHLPRELVVWTRSGSPITVMARFAWCNVRSTPCLTCVFMLVKCGIARTSAIVRGRVDGRARFLVRRNIASLL